MGAKERARTGALIEGLDVRSAFFSALIDATRVVGVLIFSARGCAERLHGTEKQCSAR